MKSLYLRILIEIKLDPKDIGSNLKSHGRSAIIYYVDNMGIVPIDCEMSGVGYLDVLVYGETQYIPR